jgi:hypothetical protein
MLVTILVALVTLFLITLKNEPSASQISRCVTWDFDEGLAAVYFGADGRTTGKECLTESLKVGLRIFEIS